MTRLARRPRVLRPLLAGLLVPALLAVAPSSSGARASVAADDGTSIAPAGPLLDEAQRGSEAIRQLGDKLGVAAARNDLRPGQLRALLRSDRTAWVDRQGALFYVDPAPSPPPADGGPSRVAPHAPLAQTFELHSNPGASLSLLLDFDGATVSGTQWNTEKGVQAGDHPAWDPAGDGPAFSAGEQAQIQQIWAFVAEDYAPFDVDVTTQDPGAAGMLRSSGADTVYGSRVLVSPSADAWQKTCANNCGGIAYLDVFDVVGGAYQPAWVFPQALHNDAKDIAEAASHEAGHNLGLEHDGGPGTAGYYSGHGVWAPIMGVGYDRPLVQWSQGSYNGANNQQDDLTILTAYLGARADEASDSEATPSTLPDGSALIGTPQDTDAYQLGSCAPGTVVQVLPAAVSPNLDLRAVLVDGGGTPQVTAEPAAGATANLAVPAGEGWVLQVDGVGDGTWAGGGYDDYGSLGAYTVAASGCDGALASGAPSAPVDVVAGTPTTDSLPISWSAPASQGDGPVTGYVVSRSGSATTQTLGAGARSHTFSGLAPGTTYQLSVRALNAAGAGPTVTVSATTQGAAPAAPSIPRNVTGGYDQASGALQAFWTEPADPGTQPISAYVIYLDGGAIGQLDSDARGVYLTNPSGFSEGDYVIGIAAVNAVGSSPVATVTVTVGDAQGPANDDVADAQVLTGASGSVTGDNSLATAEGTDPAAPGGAGGYSVWYSWTPTGAGPVTMQTSGGGADRDTTLAVYTGTPGALALVVGNDDSGSLHAQVGFTATAGTRYLVAVDGFASDGGHGPFTLAWAQTVSTGPPLAPTGVSVARGDSAATVSWNAANPHGSPVTGYRVTSTPGGLTCTTTGALSCGVAGLANGTAYTFTVRATNALGDSPESAPSSAVTPAGVPLPPSAPTAVAGDAAALVSWSAAPGNGAPVTGYSVTSSPGGLTCTTTGALACAVAGLSNGTAYTFVVTATNAVGTSEESPPSATVTPIAAPATAPGKMAKPKVVVRGRNVTVSWGAAPAKPPTLRYLVDLSKGKDRLLPAGSRKTVFKAMKPGAYKVRVAARNAVGTSPYSLWVSFRVR